MSNTFKTAFLLTAMTLLLLLIGQAIGGRNGLTIALIIAGVIASMPNLMGFSDKGYANFFHGQGIAMAAVTGLTDFEGERETVRERCPRRVA